MIKEHNKRITVTLHEMTVDMLDQIARETKKTKSEILGRWLKMYTLEFWLNPEQEIEEWKEKFKDDKQK